ncbi:hypothetical protein LTS18_006573 [Coniosporium uncinatum]|uniref:Uncharacterized protein n=1 Tax=Coniosporium uncinatum TaxID=93489 RepID=A0ACC3DYZ4_9PEZI|nr:hypothetical protein LTS18_006573 [Coniosporium uncinatum]
MSASEPSAELVGFLDYGGDTVPNTPEPLDVEETIFARLIPINKLAMQALANTDYRRSRATSYHKQFIQEVQYNNQLSLCFTFSLTRLPQFPRLGWHVGQGKASSHNHYGVDFMLSGTDEGKVSRICARFHWIGGLGGFFLTPRDSGRSSLYLNGELLKPAESRAIPVQNCIGIGELLFTFRYSDRSEQQERQFQEELSIFFDAVYKTNQPHYLPSTPGTPSITFGDWQVGYSISSGTFGAVYMVQHIKNGTRAALKQLIDRKDQVGRHEKIVQEYRMADIIQSFKHDRVASLLGADWDPSVFSLPSESYFILSPLESTTLLTLIESGRHDVCRTTCFAQILSGVAFLHSKGVYHRDIKPTNILVRSFEPPMCKITDFGSATSESKIMYDWPGTVPYLAPEQVENREHEGHLVDAWACGLVGVQLLGVHGTPFHGIGHSRLDGPLLGNLHTYLAQYTGPTGQVHACCRGMLNVDPNYRMTVAYAASKVDDLLHRPCSQNDDNSRKRGALSTTQTIKRQK